MKFSPREHEILKRVVVGATAKEIAHRLEVSNHMVDNHTQHLFKKLGVCLKLRRFALLKLCVV